MVRALAAKELREAVRSVRFLAVVLVSLTLVPASVFVNTRAYEHRLQYHEELTRLSRAQSEAAGLRADMAAEAFRGPSVPGILFGGAEPALPSRIRTSRDGLFTVYSENRPADLSSGSGSSTDLAFLTGLVLSLLAFVFVHGSITREKEEGSLRLLLSTGAPRGAVLAGKILGNFTAFVAPVAIGVGIGMAVMVSSPAVRAQLAGQVPLLFALFALVLVLLFLLLLVGLFISMFANRSGVAIVLLLFVWVLLVPGLPLLAPIVAEIAFPAKPYQVVEMEKRLIRTSASTQFREAVDSLYDVIMQRHEVDMDTLEVFVPQRLTGKAREAHLEYERKIATLEAADQAYVHDMWGTLDSTRESAVRSQRRLASFITGLSPVGIFWTLSATLAGTGADEWDRILAFARDFQGQVTEELYGKWLVRPYGRNRVITMPAAGNYPPAVDRSRLHAVLPPAPMAGRVRAGLPDMLLLAVMTLLAGTGCWLKFRSYDAR